MFYRYFAILIGVVLLDVSCSKQQVSTVQIDTKDTTTKQPCEINNTAVLRINSTNKYRFEITLNNQYLGLQAGKTSTDWIIPSGIYLIKIEQYEGYILNPIIISNSYVANQCDTILISY